MFGRAVTAFRKSVIKSKSSTGISNSERDEDDDDTCNESIISSRSLSVASFTTENPRRVSITPTTTSRLSLLKRQRRSQSANREGECSVQKLIIQYSQKMFEILYERDAYTTKTYLDYFFHLNSRCHHFLFDIEVFFVKFMKLLINFSHLKNTEIFYTIFQFFSYLNCRISASKH